MKIMVDAMCGKLGNFLRILGFDTEIADKSWSDQIVLKNAIEDNRILVTRDKAFYEVIKRYYKEENMNENRVLFIEEDNLERQLASFFLHMKINPNNYQWLGEDILSFQSRCTKCNGEVKHVSKESITDRIPKGTASRYNNFYQCTDSNCKQIYWVGKAHWEDIFRKIRKATRYMKEI